MIPGQVAIHFGAAAPLGSLREAQWLSADRVYDADWFKDALKDKAKKSCIPGRKSRGEPIEHDERRYKRFKVIEVSPSRCSTTQSASTRSTVCCRPLTLKSGGSN